MKRYFSKIPLAIFVIIFITVILGVVAEAAEEQKEIPLGLPQQIGDFYSFALGIGGLVALGVLVYGGILYTVSAGNDSRISEAKDWITGAMVGLLLLFGSFFILNIINPELTKLTDLKLLANKAAESVGNPNPNYSPSPFPVINGETCPVGKKPSYSLDSFCGKWGPGKSRIDEFAPVCQATCGYQVCHGGVDLFVDLNTAVYAIENGELDKNSWGWNDTGGNRLWLHGDSGYSYYYAHLIASPLVSAGARVEAGELLGYADKTGNAVGTPSHLHLEAHSKDGPQNPLPLIQRTCNE